MKITLSFLLSEKGPFEASFLFIAELGGILVIEKGGNKTAPCGASIENYTLHCYHMDALAGLSMHTRTLESRRDALMVARTIQHRSLQSLRNGLFLSPCNLPAPELVG